MQDIKFKTSESLYWKFASGLVNNVLNIIVALILTFLLDPEDFGVFAIVVLFLGILSIFIGQGFSKALIQKEELLEEEKYNIYIVNIILGWSAFLLSIGFGYVLDRMYGGSNFTQLCSIYGVSFVFQGFCALKIALLSKNLEFAFLSKLSMRVNFFSCLVVVLLALWEPSPLTLVFRISFASILTYFILRQIGIQIKPTKLSFTSLERLHTFSKYVFLGSLIRYVLTNLDYALMTGFMTTTDIGHYNRAKQISFNIGSEIKKLTSQVAFPVLSKINARNRKASFFKFILLLNVLVLPALLLILFCAHDIIGLMFPEKWRGIQDILVYLYIGGIIHSTSMPGALLLSMGEAKLEFVSDSVANVVRALILGIGITFQDLESLVISVVVGMVSVIVIKNFFAYFKCRVSIREIFKFQLLPLLFSFTLLVLLLQVFANLDFSPMLELILKVSTIVVAYSLFFLLCFKPIKKALSHKLGIWKGKKS